ncbi:MAG TPA: SemiSWEET family transporter [archaeon]|nr:SemiSWEET family transporter [archaeon]
MPQNIHGHHHFHKRMRIEPYPSPNRWKKFLDKIIYIIVFIGPVMTVPQVIDIWMGKNAAGVSIISWGAYTATSLFWLVYGIAHKDKPIIISSIAWAVLEILIVIGALVY